MTDLPAYKIPDESDALRVPLFPKPTRVIAPPPRTVTVRLPSGETLEALELAPADETEEAFAARLADWQRVGGIMLRVRQLPPEEAADADRRARAAAHAERNRVASLRAAHPPETHPVFHGPLYETEEGERDLATAALDLLGKTVLGIDGLELGASGRPSSQLAPEAAVRVLHRMGWHHQAARRVREAQHLIGIEHFC